MTSLQEYFDVEHPTHYEALCRLEVAQMTDDGRQEVITRLGDMYHLRDSDTWYTTPKGLYCTPCENSTDDAAGEVEDVATNESCENSTDDAAGGVEDVATDESLRVENASSLRERITSGRHFIAKRLEVRLWASRALAPTRKQLEDVLCNRASSIDVPSLGKHIPAATYNASTWYNKKDGCDDFRFWKSSIDPPINGCEAFIKTFGGYTVEKDVHMIWTSTDATHPDTFYAMSIDKSVKVRAMASVHAQYKLIVSVH